MRPRAQGPAWERHAFAFGDVAVLLALFVASAAYLASGTHNPFIYFRF